MSIIKKLAAIAVVIVMLIALCACGDETPVKDTPPAYISYANDEDADALMHKTNGFLKGVCHPSDNIEQIKAANIEWIRRDIPFLYNADGSISQSYLNYKARMTRFAEAGIKVLGITPYPDDYYDYGLDPRDPANDEAIQAIALYYLNDLKDCVAGFQITNEMGVAHFMEPYETDDLAGPARFIGIQLEAMYPVRGDKIIGYNNGGIEGFTSLNQYMQDYLQYCDYVGVDIYAGCFEYSFKEITVFRGLIDMVYEIVQKPIILTEFGYIGLGQTKTEEEKKAFLKDNYGYNSEAEARADMENLFTKLPADLQEYLEKTTSSYEEMAKDLFETEVANHLYLEVQEGFQLTNYQHTLTGQAQFFTDTIELLTTIDYLCGAFVYCYSDSDECYICGQSNCPVETAWGLVDREGNPKPSYYAVQAAFGAIE